LKKLNLFFFFSFSFLIYSSAQTVINYSYEPAVQHFNVPPGVSTITVTISGAHGAGALGGKGASFTGICNVISPHVLSVAVGQEGMTLTDTNNWSWGGGGGGASWVYDSNVVLYNPIENTGLIAAAAGGGGQVVTRFIVFLSRVGNSTPEGMEELTLLPMLQQEVHIAIQEEQEVMVEIMVEVTNILYILLPELDGSVMELDGQA
jgi:hypothetical protein